MIFEVCPGKRCRPEFGELSLHGLDVQAINTLEVTTIVGQQCQAVLNGRHADQKSPMREPAIRRRPRSFANNLAVSSLMPIKRASFRNSSNVSFASRWVAMFGQRDQGNGKTLALEFIQPFAIWKWPFRFRW